MMLPNRPTNPPDTGSSTTKAQTPPSAEALAAIVKDSEEHVDYDRHPLAVHSLDHYIESPVAGDRFRVS